MSWPSKFVYIHVPKCGGSSFGAALRMQCLLSQSTISLGQGNPALEGEARILDDYAKRQHQLRGLMTQGKRMIAGHVQYDPHLHQTGGRDYCYITLLRDPVARFISHYQYLQRKHPDIARAATLEAFLETPDAQRLASQYLFYFAGQSQPPDGAPKALIAQAIANLARFDLVGDLAAPAQFQDDLKMLTGMSLPRWRRNAAPVPCDVQRHLRDTLTALCAADIAIYNAALPARQAA